MDRIVVARPAQTPQPPLQTPPLHTPLVWAWGGLLLTVSAWLTGIIALFNSLGSLFG